MALADLSEYNFCGKWPIVFAALAFREAKNEAAPPGDCPLAKVELSLPLAEFIPKKQIQSALK